MVEVPVLVVCKDCGVIYDYRIAKETCPLCGSKNHRSLHVEFMLGSAMMTVREEVD